MHRAGVIGVLVLAALAATARSAPAQAPVPCAAGAPTNGALTVTTSPGLVNLAFFLVDGATVTFYECRDGRGRTLGTAAQPGDVTTLPAAVTWRCDRLVRSFAAMATRPDGVVVYGTTDVRTTSCAHRYDVAAPRRVRRGRPVRVTVTDRFLLGDAAGRLCAVPPSGPARCVRRRLDRLVSSTSATFRLRERGRWTLRWRAPHGTASTAVAVGERPPPPLPTVLATGDSTMIGVDGFLADELAGRARVVSQPFPGVGISARDEFQPIAVGQVADQHPDVTVLSIGANEGFPMTAADGTEHGCCDAAWKQEYRHRLLRTVRTYRQHGHAGVVLCTIQLPQAAVRVPVFEATNAVIASLAGRTGVTVVRLDRIFTPQGYTETIVYRGRTVDVREPDGIHLNVAGTSIAARAIARAVRL